MCLEQSFKNFRHDTLIGYFPLLYPLERPHIFGQCVRNVKADLSSYIKLPHFHFSVLILTLSGLFFFSQEFLCSKMKMKIIGNILNKCHFRRMLSCIGEFFVITNIILLLVMSWTVKFRFFKFILMIRQNHLMKHFLL